MLLWMVELASCNKASIWFSSKSASSSSMRSTEGRLRW